MRSARGPLAVVVALVAGVLGSVVGVFVVLDRIASSAVVEGVEVDRAGLQRRLAERIAYDVEVLTVATAAGADPAATAGVRDELRLTAQRLDDVRTELTTSADRLGGIESGLLHGDDSLGLDGVVPSEVRRLYGPDGLDLSRRIDDYTAAARRIADADAPAAADIGSIRTEAVGERMVTDLDQVVRAFSVDLDARADRERDVIRVGLWTISVLSVLTLLALVSALRRAGRERAESRRLADELAESEALYRSTVDLLRDGIYVQDEDGTVLRSNAAARAIFEANGGRMPDVAGGSMAEALERSPMRKIDEAGDEVTEERRVSRRALAEDRPIIGEVYGMTDGAVTRWYRADAIPYADPAGRRRVVVSFSDITERREAEDAQRLALERERDVVAKLRELDRTKTSIVSTVSHELRTPLTAIIATLDLLSNGVAGALDDRQDPMVKMALRNSHRLLHLIEDLLTISAIESGGVELDLVETPLAPVIRAAVADARPLADAAALELVVHGDSGAVVVGDELRLRQVLDNLVSNAIKFTGPGGTITVGFGPDHDRPDAVRIGVTDTGVGIPEDEQAQLFSRFFRSSTAYANAVPGTGLGLAISADLVRAHHGHLEVTSTEGVGTTVEVVLPAADSDLGRALRARTGEHDVAAVDAEAGVGAQSIDHPVE